MYTFHTLKFTYDKLVNTDGTVWAEMLSNAAKGPLETIMTSKFETIKTRVYDNLYDLAVNTKTGSTDIVSTVISDLSDLYKLTVRHQTTIDAVKLAKNQIEAQKVTISNTDQLQLV